MTQHYQIGDVRVSRIEELMGPMFDPVRFLLHSIPHSLINMHPGSIQIMQSASLVGSSLACTVG